jgi:hypothetical protein
MFDVMSHPAPSILDISYLTSVQFEELVLTNLVDLFDGGFRRG